MLRGVLAIVAAVLGALIVLPALLPALLMRSMNGLVQMIASRLQPAVLPWGAFVEFEPVIGWKPRPNIDAHHLADGIFRAKTGPDGWPGERSLGESDVVVFGDSFAWGYGVDAQEFFPAVETRVRVKAIGANGYNTVQQLLWMKRLAPELSGKLVVWLVYCGNDLYENLVPEMGAYRMPFVRSTKAGGWEIVTEHISPARWPYTLDPLNEGRDYYGKLAELCTDGFLSDRAYSACEFLISEGCNVCRDVGARLVVITVPDQTQLDPALIAQLRAKVPDDASFDPRKPDLRLAGICERLGVRFVPGCNWFERLHYKERDCHWNARGHRRIADLIFELHRDDAPAAREVAAATGE